MNTEGIRESSLLLIDDEEANLDLLEGLLLSEGYTRITRVADARRAMAAFASCAPDLVLLDLHMPFLTGYEILEEMRSAVPADDYLPVLVLTADVTTDARDRALSRGARDFLTKPFDAVEVLLRVRNLLETRLLHQGQARARARAEMAEVRARLLSDASKLLSTSLDSETGIAQVSRLLVPRFASSAHFLLTEAEGYRVAASSRNSDEAKRLESALETEGETVAAALAGDSPATLRLDDGDAFLTPLQANGQTFGALITTHAGASDQQEVADVDTLRDLAGRAALALQNACLFADAQMASRARERMLSVVAHDLRNPLAVIAMYAEMLLDLLPGDSADDGDDYAAEALTSIHRSARRMQEQIESLLDISRLQQGRFVVSPSPHCVTDLFHEAAMLLQPLAAAKAVGLQIERVGDATVDTAVLDGGRIHQVLSNLVGNAVKFSPEGTCVVVRWRVAASELTVSVEDCGPGIPADLLPHIFGAFWQANLTDRRGVGLGLWIARAIVDGHGGRIWVDSIEGKGATFHFAIPTAPPAQPDEPGAALEEGIGRMTHETTPLTH